MVKITAEICDSREIHSKMTAKWRHH